MRKPGPSIAYLKAGTILTVAMALACAPFAARDALAIKIFGMTFFEDDEAANAVIDPVSYTLDLQPGTGDAELTETIQNASALYTDREEPVSGNLGLVIKARDDRDRLLAALYEKGRYGAVIDIRVNGEPIDSLPADPVFPDGAPVPVTVAVTPGPAFTFGEIRFEGDASVRDPAEYGLLPGARADSGLIIKAGERIVADMREEGRPLAKLTSRTAEADHDASTIDVVIAAESGPVAPVGAVSVKGASAVDPEFIRTYSRLNAGKPYSPEDIRKASERLRQLGVFASVTVKEGDSLAADGSVPMTIEVSEGKFRYFGFGAQVSTTEGLGLQGYWGHRNLFGRAESLRVEGSVDRIGEASGIQDLDYSAGILFAKPGAFGPASQFTASVKASLVDPDAYSAKIVTAAAGASFELSPTDQVSAGVDLVWADVDDAFGSRSYLTASVPLDYVRDTRDDKLNATSGYRAALNVRPSFEIEEGTPFASIEGSASGYYGLGAENRFVLAGRVGAGVLLGGDSLADIPAYRRFFLGGGGTVRGYSFQEISPRDGANALTGGRSYVSGTVEARIGVTDTIGVVPFIDVGTVGAGSTPDFGDFRAGAGVGLRYATPFGPIRLDVAVPLNPYPGGTTYGIYAGIGQSF